MSKGVLWVSLQKKLGCTLKELGLVFKTQIEFPVSQGTIFFLNSLISEYISICHACVEGSPEAAPKHLELLQSTEIIS